MLNNKVDKIFYINLDRRIDRLEFILNEFKKHGIKDTERFSAIDGNIDNITSSLLPGEIGCILSHLEITKIAKERGLKNYLVFEDDVIFHDDFERLFEQFYKEIPDDWDMIYLGGSNIDNSPIKITENIYKIFNTYTTHSIIVKDTLYDSIIEMLPKLEKQVDVYFADLQKSFNCYIVTPRLIWQRSGFSDIQMKEIDYKFLN